MKLDLEQEIYLLKDCPLKILMFQLAPQEIPTT